MIPPFVEVVNTNRRPALTFSTELVKCPQCRGAGTVTVSHSGDNQKCLYCNGMRVVEERKHHQEYIPR
jgi:DnaJ-class molecular chaperone